MNYIEKIRKQLDDKLGMRFSKYEGLLDFYALLVLTVGVNCTKEHVHDAWSIWCNNIEPEHRSLIPFSELTQYVQELDEKYSEIIVNISKDLSI